MTETKPGPWARLLEAAREAQDLVAAEHHDQISGGWDSDDAKQVYEDLGCAALDVEESGVDADAAPDLLAACEAARLALRATSAAAKDYGHELRLLGAALAKAKGG